MVNIKKKYKYTYTFSVTNYWSWHKAVNIFSAYGRVKRVGKNKFIINTDKKDFGLYSVDIKVLKEVAQ